MTTSTEPPTGELITLVAAAERLDVHYMTAYRYVRTGRMHAEKRSGKWWVTEADLRAVLDEGTGRRPARPGPENREQLVEPLVTRLVAGDTAGCWDLLSDALSSGATPTQIHAEVLRGALERIGEGWHQGEFTIADEHRATASVYRLLGQLGPLFRHRGRRRGSVVVGTVEGDMHAIPSAMLADLLSDRRFEVTDLGANTPADSFISVARSVDGLVGVGVSVLLDNCVDTALQTVHRLQSELPGVFIVVGGPAVQRHGEAEFAALADVVSASAEEACDAFERHHDAPDPAMDAASA